jgi:hypothetical protein
MSAAELSTSYDLGDPKPDARRARALRGVAQERLLLSFRALIESVEGGLEREFPSARSVLRTMDPERRFSSELFVLHEQLLQALSRDDADEAVALIESIASATESRCYAGDGLELSSRVDEPWTAGAIDILKGSASADMSPTYLSVTPLSDDAFAALERDVTRSLEHIATVDPAMDAELREHVGRIVLFEGQNITGATSLKFYGSILLRANYSDLPAVVYYADHLVHEASHLNLYATLLHDPLLLNDPAETYLSPIRQDARPLLGVFHGSYVLGRVLRFHRLAAERSDGAAFAGRVPIVAQSFVEALETVERYGRPTALGKRMIEGMRSLR